MTNINMPIFDTDPPYRILALDGGGIYGLFTALMLRHLCHRDKKFLDPRHAPITLFAGCSAGALSALMLASEENPREAVLDGKLERFFKDERVYSNKLNPVAGWLSLFMLTSWSGRKDFYSVLDDYFGNKKMNELEHRVMISTFDFRGTPDLITGQTRWAPKFFYNFPEGEKDRELLIKDVAYGAASPPTLRPVHNGITDGGLFAIDPSVTAIAKVVSVTREARDAMNIKINLSSAFKQQNTQLMAHLAGKTEEMAKPLPRNLGKKVTKLLDRMVELNLIRGAFKEELDKQFEDFYNDFSVLEEAIGEFFCWPDTYEQLLSIVISAGHNQKSLQARIYEYTESIAEKYNLSELEDGEAPAEFAEMVGIFKSMGEWQEIFKFFPLLAKSVYRYQQKEKKLFDNKKNELKDDVPDEVKESMLYRAVQKEMEFFKHLIRIFSFSFKDLFDYPSKNEVQEIENIILDRIRDTHREGVVITKDALDEVTKKAQSQLGLTKKEGHDQADAKSEETEDDDAIDRSLRHYHLLYQVMQLRGFLYEKLESHAVQPLKHISVLSLGVGSKIPSYAFENFDLGALPFNFIPTNPMQGFFTPPIDHLMLNPSTDTVTYKAKQLLGEDNYFRLNPPVIGFPVPSVIQSVYLARWKLWRDFIIKEIEKIANSQLVERQIRDTLEWMPKHFYREE